jgi:hypothetical protein
MKTQELNLVLKNKLYSGVHLCTTLKAKEKCFHILKYKEGTYVEIFHEHIPRHRISKDNAIAWMITLIVKHRSLGGLDALRGYMNKRGKNQVLWSLDRCPLSILNRAYCEDTSRMPIHAFLSMR